MPPAPAAPNVERRTSSSASVWFGGTVTATLGAPLLSPIALFDPSRADWGRKYKSASTANAFGLTMRSDVTNCARAGGWPVALAEVTTHCFAAGVSARSDAGSRDIAARAKRPNDLECNMGFLSLAFCVGRRPVRRRDRA